ncbi:MAG: hypothetical protein NXI12_12400 [Alphaproteobacteria bacterium]|nr:hypothetical protein [Alphaproteobacteria bacterium]
MPFFYRGGSGSVPQRSRATMRIATLAALTAYPAGCILQIVFPDATPEPGLAAGEIAGFALVAVSLLAFCFIAPSWLQRIVGEQADCLDEFEMDLRRRAYTFSYNVFAGMAVLFAIYMALSVDLADSGKLQLWTPATYDHWNAIFWGAMLYAFVLPTTWLAWAGPALLEDLEDAAA